MNALVKVADRSDLVAGGRYALLTLEGGAWCIAATYGSLLTAGVASTARATKAARPGAGRGLLLRRIGVRLPDEAPRMLLASPRRLPVRVVACAYS